MKHFILAPLLLTPLLLGATTLTEVVQQTIETHPQIQIKKEDLNVQKESLTQIKADYLPSVDLSYVVGPEVTRTPANQREQAELIRQEASASLSQNVFAGLDTMYGVDQQKALVLSAGNSVEETANTLALETITSYVEVLRTKKLLTIATENVNVHKKYLAQIEKKVNAGVQRHSDYQQTLSRMENALSAEYLAQQNYDNSVYSFERILPSIENVNDFEQPIMEDLPANDIEALVALAIKSNPTIHVSEADIDVAQSALKRSNAPFMPTADIKLEGYWNDQVHGVGYDDPALPGKPINTEDTGYNALLLLNYNIFNGLADSAVKQANQHKLLKQNATLADAKRFVKANTQIAFKTYDLTKKQLVHISKNVEASKKTVSDYQRENELGRRSIIDLLNIELEYNGARNRHATAEFDQLLAYYQILANTGTLLKNMNVVIK